MSRDSDNVYEFLRDSIPADHCAQVTAEAVLTARVRQGFKPRDVLDFGCGDGRSLKMFRTLAPEARWTGVDIASSPEVDSRGAGRQDDARFVTYDGYELPFQNEAFDLVYSHQVLEHVRKPELALREIGRVLRPQGLFVGQTSQFEVYHSYSLWNFTVYGFKRLVEDAGLVLAELRPGIDGFTLMKRTYSGRPPEMSRWFVEESPMNVEIETSARAAGRNRQGINFRKLIYCGQFIFVVRRR